MVVVSRTGCVGVRGPAVWGVLKGAEGRGGTLRVTALLLAVSFAAVLLLTRSTALLLPAASVSVGVPVRGVVSSTRMAESECLQ